MYEDQSEIVTEMASALVEFASKIDSSWKKAYYRFYIGGPESGSIGSCVGRSGIHFIDGLTHVDFCNALNELGKRLFSLFGQKRGLLLLSVDSNMEFNIDFEFEDLNKWRIIKSDGSSGIPEGIE